MSKGIGNVSKLNYLIDYLITNVFTLHLKISILSRKPGIWCYTNHHQNGSLTPSGYFQ